MTSLMQRLLKVLSFLSLHNVHPPVLSRLSPQAPSRISDAIRGNPTMPSIAESPGEPTEQLPSLPGAEREAKAIADLLDNKALIGDQATKAFIMRQMRRSRIIHLATHGLLDDVKRLGIPGAIALAPGRVIAFG